MSVFPLKLRFWTALVLVLVMSVLDFGPAMAGLAPSQPSGTTAIASTRDADLLAAQRLLEHKVVAQKLLDYGVTPEEARIRLAGMSDQDLHTLASASRGLPSGGDGTGTVIGLLIIVLLVILILKILNREVIIR